MNKKLIFLLLSLLAMTACHEKDEPNVEVFFQDLIESPTNGIYEGFICDNSAKDIIGIWCEITHNPDDISQDVFVPRKGSHIYINRKVFPRKDINVGTTIRFQIIDFNAFPATFPYGYIFFLNREYFIANINLIDDNLL